MELEVNNDLWAEVKCAALKVEFLNTNEELKLYAINLYNASIWGMEVDRSNKAIRERDKSVK